MTWTAPELLLAGVLVLAAMSVASIFTAIVLDVRRKNRQAVMDFRTQVADLLAYLDLHIGRYQWKVLTTEQKELMADLVDESCARMAIREGWDDPRTVTRWWRS